MTATFHAAPGVTYAGFATEPPLASIGAGLKSLLVLGTARDGLSLTNRVLAGPAPVITGSGPVYSAVAGTVNNGASAQGIDSGLVETADIVSSGWTMFCVGKQSVGAGNNGTFLSIGSTGIIELVFNAANTNYGSQPSVFFASFGVSVTADQGFALPGPVSTERFYALTFTGNSGAKTYTIHDITDGISHTTTFTQTRTAVSTSHFCVGRNSGSWINYNAQTDVFASGFATTPWTQAQLISMRNWLRGVATLRGRNATF
jgi:hypothetical protein